MSPVPHVQCVTSTTCTVRHQCHMYSASPVPHVQCVTSTTCTVHHQYVCTLCTVCHQYHMYCVSSVPHVQCIISTYLMYSVSPVPQLHVMVILLHTSAQFGVLDRCPCKRTQERYVIWLFVPFNTTHTTCWQHPYCMSVSVYVYLRACMHVCMCVRTFGSVHWGIPLLLQILE